MSLLARFQLERARRHNQAEGPPDHDYQHSNRTPSRSPTHLTGSFQSPGNDSLHYSPFPPAQRQRRYRSPSSDELGAEHVVKRRKLHALDICRENQLEDNALDQFAELDVAHMLITLHGKLMGIERKKEQDEAHVFIRSSQFKEILKDRLRSCLLSPNLSKYLAELPEHVWGFMKNNTGVFKIPPKALEDSELTEYIDSLMKDVLTKQRAQIKNKIVISISKCQHISQLAKSLAQKDFVDVTKGQWARFAFLRQNMIVFNKIVAESVVKKAASLDTQERPDVEQEESEFSDYEGNNNNGKQKNNDKEAERLWDDKDFWEFVDTLLDQLRNDVEKQPTAELRKWEWDKMFNDTLQDDLKTFPASNKNSRLCASDGKGAADWQRAIHQQLVWL